MTTYSISSIRQNHNKVLSDVQSRRFSLPSDNANGEKSSALGNNASFVVSQSYRDFQKTLKLIDVRDKDTIEQSRKIEKIRYRMLSTIRKSLKKYAKKNHRIAECHYGIHPNGKKPTIKYSDIAHSSSWHNVKTCNDEFCPVCSVRVGNANRVRIARIMAEAYKQNYVPVLVTLTIQHDRRHSAADNVDALANAWRKMLQDVNFRKLKEKYGLFGYIRGVDQTFSFENGLHHHAHVCYLVEADKFDERDFPNKPDYDPDCLWQQWADIWRKHVQSEGRDCIDDYALNFQVGDQYIAEYVAKHGHAPKQSRWDITAEMSLKTVKRAPDEHYTLFELMLLAHAGDVWAQKMYAEFVDAMQNKNRLRMSKTVLELEKMIVDEPEPEPQPEPEKRPEFVVTFDAWRVARNHRNMRGKWLKLHEDKQYKQLAHEVAHAHVLGAFQYQSRTQDYQIVDGWNSVYAVNLQGKYEFVEQVEIGRVWVSSGRAKEVAITQSLESGFYGKLRFVDDSEYERLE